MLRSSSLFGVFASLAACQSVPEAPNLDRVDLIIAGGEVHDGAGSPAMIADIAIRGDRIVYVGADARSLYRAAEVLDAGGHIVAPGFIDPHTHAGPDLASKQPGRRANSAFAFQGVTTVVIGNDGGGDYAISDLADAARSQGIGTNAAYLVGFNSVRRAVMETENRPPKSAELVRMQELTQRGMCEGAWGFSTGLYYVPQSYSNTEEVIALARIAADMGGYYDTHMRDESTYNVTVTGALAEALQIGREAGLPVHISHIKALGPAVWGHSERMIAMIEEAQALGQEVTADQYPWEASGTRITAALVPREALEGGLEALRERLDDPKQLTAIRSAMIAAIERRGGPDRLLITGSLNGAKAPIGRTLAEIGKQKNLEPVDAALAILSEGDARLASFNMSPDDIAAFASREWVVTGSDGSTGHPRKYGSFPKAYRDLVIGTESMDLARFIRRSSGKTADIIGLQDRGYLRAGYAADVLVFDPDTFAPNATYASPRELSSGVAHLFVNGQATISDGISTGTLPGRPLLKQPPRGYNCQG